MKCCESTHEPLIGGYSRRDFLKVCTAAAVYMGLSESFGPKIAEAASKAARRPSVIWLSGQECTGDHGLEVHQLSRYQEAKAAHNVATDNRPPQPPLRIPKEIPHGQGTNACADAGSRKHQPHRNPTLLAQRKDAIRHGGLHHPERGAEEDRQRGFVQRDGQDVRMRLVR